MVYDFSDKERTTDWTTNFCYHKKAHQNIFVTSKQQGMRLIIIHEGENMNRWKLYKTGDSFTEITEQMS